ncbi:MAG: hypothetical protein AAB692_05420 [Patescibacteria group bacterium]
MKKVVRRTARRKSAPPNRMGMYVLLVFTVAALLIAYGLQSAGPFGSDVTPGSRLGPSQPPAPDFTTIIPGARFGGAASAYDDDPVSPGFAVGYARDGKLWLGVVVWNSREARYGLAVEKELAHGSDAIGGLPAVRIEKMPAGVSLIAASGPDAGTGWTYLFRRAGNGLEPINVTQQDGAMRPVAFWIDGSAKLEDVDGDGTVELLLEQVDGGGVHRWDGTQFVWDSKLTWALETRDRLFPKPKNP